MNQKQKILLGLLVALAIALAYRLTNPFEQDTVDRLTYAPATKVAPGKFAGASQHQAQVRLDLFRSPPQNSVTIQRDLFQPPTTPNPSSKKNEAPPPKPRPKSDRDKIQEHFKRFKTFGSYQHGKKIYLFLERGKQVLVVSRGDRIDGKYEITEVAEKSATISSKDLSTPLKVMFDEL